MPSSYLLVNGLRIHYLHWNLGVGERPVILLHGLASNARIWDLVAPYLVDAGLTLYAPDTRGHGLTDPAEDGYDTNTFIGDLAAFIRANDLERPVMVGHSWGGMLALEYAARFPFGPRSPSGLILVDGGFVQLDRGEGTTWEETRRRLEPPKLIGTPVEVIEEILQAPKKNWHPGDDAVRSMLADFEVDQDGAVYPHLSYEHHMQILRSIWEFHPYKCFSQVSCPVMAVVAETPDPTPEEQQFIDRKRQDLERASQALPDLQVVWMKDSVHDIPLQRPAELGNLMARFIASLP